MREKIVAAVTAQREIAHGIFSLHLHAPSVAAEACAGQFVNLYCADACRLLPRPVSLAEIDAAGGNIRLVYRVSGAGTREFSGLAAGDQVALLGPLGNGFPIAETAGRQVFLFGGGIGIPPLLETARAIRSAAQPAQRVTAVLGYRDSATFLAEEFAAVCDRILIATEDGSVGTSGNVLDALRGAGISLQCGEQKTTVFACGPAPMLRALQKEAEGTNCWISLEEHMACGIGACLACVCKTREKDAHSQVNNRRVCKDGPVFRAEDIVL